MMVQLDLGNIYNLNIVFEIYLDSMILDLFNTNPIHVGGLFEEIVSNSLLYMIHLTLTNTTYYW